jgi:hypothetical protein
VRDMRDQHWTLFEWYDSDPSVDFIVGRWRPETEKDIFGDEGQWLDVAKEMAQARDALERSSSQPLGIGRPQDATTHPIEPPSSHRTEYTGSDPLLYSFCLSGLLRTPDTNAPTAFPERTPGSPPGLSAINPTGVIPISEVGLPSFQAVTDGTYPLWPGAREGDPLDGSPPR